MKKILVANWKMNPNSRDEAEALAGAVCAYAKNKEVEILLAPPFVYLDTVSRVFLATGSQMKLCAQNVFWETQGAFTGEVSPTMLRSEGVSHVILGHSERRKWLGETDVVVNKKIKSALGRDLNVILCVGEQKETRDKGLDVAKLYIKSQLQYALEGINTADISGLHLIVAYEPIWAIGTGMADKPEDTAEMSRYIKDTLGFMGLGQNFRVLYGGSVTSENAALFFAEKDIDGALVGRAGLNAEEFGKIIEIAQKF